MEIGLSVYDIDALELVNLAVAAEEAGFASLWLGEHVVLPVGYRTDHPSTGSEHNTSHRRAIIDPATTLVDPLIALAGVAAATKRLKLATGIYLLPLRHPLAIARMTTTLQSLAEGRLLLGVGLGWLQEEFDALGVPFAGRGRRFDETISVLRRAWAGGEFDHDGTVYQFDTVLVTSEPVEVPLVLGGNTERALGRAAKVGDGWFSSGNPTLAEALRLRDRLTTLCSDEGRTGCIPIYVRMAGCDPIDVEQYRQHGFDHLTVWASEIWPDTGTLEHKRERFFESAAGLLG